MTNDIKAIADGLDYDWLLRQLAAWPTRVDKEKTTNIEYLTHAAAARITELEVALLEQCKATGKYQSMVLTRLLADCDLEARITTLEADNASLREALAYAGDALNNLCVTAASAATCEGDPSGAMQTLHSIADDALGPVRLALSTQGTTDKGDAS